jgi:hypothetical protein
MPLSAAHLAKFAAVLDAEAHIEHSEFRVR